jgi:hypothetical protein
MKGERKLRLVRGETSEAEPPFTDDEIAAAAALREAIDHGAEPLAVELQAAIAPGNLGEADLDAIVNRALGQEAAATSIERAAAEQLRAELAGEREEGADAALLRALQLAVRPTELTAARNEALIAAALRAPLRKSPLRRIAPLTMVTLTGMAALAASMALFFGRPARAPVPGAATAELVRARSADELFDATTPFPRHGEESARIDRIASARAADLRQNRFAAWGVK